MNDIILAFEKLGFSLSNEDTTDEHFYMNKWINGPYQIDAQGNENTITIRLIGIKHVEEEERYNILNTDSIFKKVSEWESYYC